MTIEEKYSRWGAQGFPTPEVDSPIPKISEVYIEDSTKALEYVWFPPTEE